MPSSAPSHRANCTTDPKLRPNWLEVWFPVQSVELAGPIVKIGPDQLGTGPVTGSTHAQNCVAIEPDRKQENRVKTGKTRNSTNRPVQKVEPYVSFLKKEPEV
ncbi:hypothetical protein MTR_1g079420 [Medicago truncatula]|uniref:Uncharacterized protein n=1 Tax=Medicago truncatula TaxID=3880 RepID=G7I5M7_MEDTR|nr:hypothetical protein MTR_1g079420 [Medicago truncatula]